MEMYMLIIFGAVILIALVDAAYSRAVTKILRELLSNANEDLNEMDEELQVLARKLHKQDQPRDERGRFTSKS